MKLFYSPGACSLAPHIVLREAGFNFTLEKVDLRAGKYSGGEYAKVNPKGYVPAIQLDNGEVLTEGAAIVQYLGDKKPESGLLPAVGSMERFRCIEWLTYISSELHKGFGPLWNPASSDDEKARATEALGKRIAYVNEKLQGRDYLLGAKLSVADAYLFTVLGWTAYKQISLDPWPNVKAFQERMAKRPKVQEAMKAEGL